MPITPTTSKPDVNGKPIIAWSIEAAIQSKCFKRIIVSTDDKEIATISKSFGAEVPFVRPAELSDDFTSTSAVIAHAIEWNNSFSDVQNKVCCLYATAPFVRSSDLQKGLELLEKTSAEYAFTVTNFSFPVQRAVRITPEKRIDMLYPKYFNFRSQDLEETFHDAGQFYWGKSSAWLAEKPIFSNDSTPLILPSYRVHDIDTPDDWVRAEWLFKAMQAK